ncbi:hypothetical protein G4B88_009048 [Cannabis sativa]|uniref:60S ribosomal export protein NMD3 n=1 Tax=Cannabis sativa TaxID=3483 RepID=A0A7J6HPK6_CANSA|nr:hypothetical protein G4B88_009048 [Cannabis sativa]
MLMANNQTYGLMPCCRCGIPMAPNDANTCLKCLYYEYDITQGLQRHVTIIHCPECDTYLQPPTTWIKAQSESNELLTFCVKRLKNMNRVRLVHAEFIWTEPHSKRIKLKLKVEKEILNGVLFQRSYVVEFVQHEHMCESCMRIQANPDQWVAAVQLRQHTYPLSFRYISPALAAIKIKQVDKGIDFFFSNRSQGVKFVEFIAKVAPVIRSRHDKQLISHDTKSNNYNYKYTFSVEISPICREDLICLPSKVTHIGHLLKPGDKALGYDLYGANCNDIELDNYKNLKSYEEKGLRKRGKARLWKLKALNMEIENDKRGEEEKMKSEYEQFLDDLEENPDMRYSTDI